MKIFSGEITLEADTGGKVKAEPALHLPETTAPSTAAGEGAIFVDTADGNLKFRPDENGTVVDLTAGGSGGFGIDEMSVGYPLTGAYPGLYTVAQFGYDPTLYTGASNFYFSSVLSVSDGALTGRARLYDVVAGVYVTGASLTTSSTTPVFLISSALTVGASSGNLKNSMTVYEIHIDVSAGGSGGSDTVTHGNSTIRASV